MNISAQIMNYRRITWLTAFAFVGIGIISWFTMPKEEDPRLKERFGVVTIPYPGASPNQVVSRVVKPLEKELFEIAEIKLIKTTARFEFAQVRIDLKDNLSEAGMINETWDEIRRAIVKAKLNWPRSVVGYELNRNLIDQDSLVYAVYGKNQTQLQLLDTSKDLKEAFLRVPGVSKVNILGNPDEQISIKADIDKLETLGVTFEQIAQRVRFSNTPIGSGTLDIGTKTTGILSNSVFEHLDELKELPIFVRSGSYVPLQQIAAVERTTKYPLEEWMSWKGHEAVGIGIVPEPNIDLIALGKKVRKTASQITIPEQQIIEEISFQPDYVQSRLHDLVGSLMLGMLIIALSLIAIMGFRVGLFVACMVPAVTLCSLGVYAYTGGALQQISIAAFVLALGLLVDNLIVIVEGVQEQLNNGIERNDAAIQTIKEFIAPLAAATATTIASFVPLLGSSGSTADFTRSIPVVTTLTLAISYIFAVFFTPTVAAYILKRNTTEKNDTFATFYSMIEAPSKRMPMLTIGVCCFILACMIPLAGKLKMQFFPLADRDQLLVTFEMPEGTNLTATKRAAQKLEKSIEDLNDVKSVAVFVGRSVPKFFYNLTQTTKSPHLAQFIVTTKNFSKAEAVREEIEDLGNTITPQAQVIAKNLGQGPPVDADLEIQLLGPDREKLATKAREIQRTLREQNGSVDVRTDVGLGQSNIVFEINDTNAFRYGLNRTQITEAIIAQSRGLRISEYRENTDPVDIVLMTNTLDKNTSSSLNEAFIAPLRKGSLKLKDVAIKKIDFEPSVLKFRNGIPVVHVYGELRNGYGFDEVLAPVVSKLQKSAPNPEVKWQIGGASEESETANRAILKVLPLGILMLLISLLAQFNSFKRLIIINSVIPFVAIGIIPGLLLMKLPFGFFSLLGGLSLIGIVVNNSILLVDYADTQVTQGLSPRSAMSAAIRRRLKPISLTTLTTIAGLLPLAFSKATLWPPFAFTVIFGLMASFVISIFIVPALYNLIYDWKNTSASKNTDALPKGVFTILLAILPLCYPQDLLAGRVLKINEIIKLASENEKVKASRIEVDEVDHLLSASKADAYFPKIALEVQKQWRDTTLETKGPFSVKIPGPPKSSWIGGIKITQPLFDINKMDTELEQLKLSRIALLHKSDFEKSIAEFSVISTYLSIVEIEVQELSLIELKNRLLDKSKELERLSILGKIGDLDKAKVRIAIRECNQGIKRIEKTKPRMHVLLGRSVGRSEPIRVIPFKDFKVLVNHILEKSSMDLFEPANKRSDLYAFETKIQQFDRKIENIDRDRYPILALEAQKNYLEPSPYSQRSWTQVTLTASLAIWNGGTRNHLQRSLLSKKNAAQLRLDALNEDLKAEAEKAWVEFKNSAKDIQIEKTSLEIAKQVAQAEERLFSDGKSPLNDTLESEFLVQEKRLKWRQAHVQALRYFYKAHFLYGRPMYTD